MPTVNAAGAAAEIAKSVTAYPNSAFADFVPSLATTTTRGFPAGAPVVSMVTVAGTGPLPGNVADVGFMLQRDVPTGLAEFSKAQDRFTVPVNDPGEFTLTVADSCCPDFTIAGEIADVVVMFHVVVVVST